MTIATKNGSVIIKDGSVAQNCGCCVTPCVDGPPFIDLSKIFYATNFGTTTVQKEFPSECGEFLFRHDSLASVTGAGSCSVQLDTFTVRAGSQILYGPVTGTNRGGVLVEKPEGVTNVSVDIFIPTLGPCGAGWTTIPSSAIEIGCFRPSQSGACCNGTTCSVKPQCQCNAEAGEVFRGVGTVCSPNPCLICGCATAEQIPVSAIVEFSGFTFDFLSKEGSADTSGAGASLADFLNALTPALTRTEVLSPQSTSVGYSTGGCTDTPCASCDPVFKSRFVTGSPAIEQNTVRFTLDCGKTNFFPTSPLGVSLSEWIIVSADGCQPPAPAGQTPSTFVFSLRLPRFIAGPSLCDVASGSVSEILAPLTSALAEWRTPGGTGVYSASSGLIKIKFNPLP